MSPLSALVCIEVPLHKGLKQLPSPKLVHVWQVARSLVGITTQARLKHVKRLSILLNVKEIQGLSAQDVVGKRTNLIPAHLLKPSKVLFKQPWQEDIKLDLEAIRFSLQNDKDSLLFWKQGRLHSLLCHRTATWLGQCKQQATPTR